MIVVGDASPIIALAGVGHLDLLENVFGEILIPEQVYLEITTNPDKPPSKKYIANAKWIEIRYVKDRELVENLLIMKTIDKGEAEAIALAAEMSADLILLDERRGRNAAKSLGLNVTGVFGILRAAKRNKILDSVKPIMDKVIENGFRYSEKIYEEFLHDVGE